MACAAPEEAGAAALSAALAAPALVAPLELLGAPRATHARRELLTALLRSLQLTHGARVAPLLPTDGSPAETLVMALAETNETHTVAFGTEAGFFQEIGIPAVICGPGDIAQAHRPDEFIALSQVAACEAFLHRLIDHIAA